MTHNVTCKGGPLHGKTYTVPDGMVRFLASGGAYKVAAKTAAWHPARLEPDAE